tara:strand:- start:330 stop:494 length:165 start_codon:yes stop_codon:yes gene_type:complete
MRNLSLIDWNPKFEKNVALLKIKQVEVTNSVNKKTKLYIFILIANTYDLLANDD